MTSYWRFLSSFLCIMLWVAVTMADSSNKPRQSPPSVDFTRETTEYGGFIPRVNDLSHIKCENGVGKLSLDLPVRFDWREHGVVTPARNQGACGSCCSFAFLACLESKILLHGGEVYDFSENNTKECNWYETGCDGGADWLTASFLNKKGTVLESCDPYVPYDTDCTDDCAYIKTVLDWQIITGNTVLSVATLKDVINNLGPVISGMFIGDSGNPDWYYEMSSYDGSYVLRHISTSTPNHQILLVGWDDTLPHTGGQGAWIAKNSWGDRWGGSCGYGNQSGYFYIAYDNACIGSYISYIDDYQDYDQGGQLYFLDEGGWTTNYGYEDLTAWGMCKYTVTTDCVLDRVEFWTNDNNTRVTIMGYGSFDGNTLSDKLFEQNPIEFERPGLHSVHLDSAVCLAQENDIYILIKFKNSSFPYPVCVDANGPSSPQRSYLSFTASNGTWIDLGAGYQSDVAIRIRTSDAAFYLQTPQGNDNYMGGTSNQIAWSDWGNINNVKIEYSPDKGKHWRVIETSVPNTGSYNWQTPNLISDSCLIKISDAVDGLPYCVSKEPFAVYCPVWPGDLDVNGVVNEEDILPLVQYWQISGAARDSLGMGWQGHRTKLWGEIMATYADANGSGRVDIADFIPICLNWHYEHTDTSQIARNIPGLDLETNREALLKIYNQISDSKAGPEYEIKKYISKLLDFSLPAKFELKGNYPNPFNGHTSISYSLPERAEVNLSIYNIIGQKVKTLLNDQFQPAGEYSVIWDGRNEAGEEVASGLYLIVMHSDDFSSAKTMTLVK